MPEERLQATLRIPIESWLFPAWAEKMHKRSVTLSLGFDPFDALHPACAEQGQADVFLTTDDGLIRRARRTNEFRTRVENPVSWYQEAVL